MSWMFAAIAAVPLLLGGVLWLTARIERWLAASEEDEP